MLTRIEIDGFKTFEDFHMDFTPFQVILGPNAAGKSNLFDALHLLSRLAGMEVGLAFSKLRGQPYELFRRQSDGTPGKRMTFAAEILLDRGRTDPWGTPVHLKFTRFRYELTIERREELGRLEGLVVTQERATPIARKEDQWRPRGEAPSPSFRDTYFLGGGRVKPILETIHAEAGPVFRIREGRREQKRPAERAEATILSGASDGMDFPHLFALREELQSWRVLQLNPAALHQPSLISDPDLLEPSGGNLAKVLARIKKQTASDVRPTGDLADIAADLSALAAGPLR